MTLTCYTSTIQAQIIIKLGTEMKRDICKRKKQNNKSIDCNTRFDDTYQRLYKYNIGIDYHHIRHRNKEIKRDMEKGKRKKVEQ